jgi:hypothetical protein
MQATTQLRDENGMTAAMRGRANSLKKRQMVQELKNQAKILGKEAGKELAQALKVESEKPLEVPARTIKEMQAFGYQIINREMSRLDRASENFGLDDDEIQSLTRLMAALNTTAKTGQKLDEPEGLTEPKPILGETEESFALRMAEYKRQLEEAANG